MSRSGLNWRLPSRRTMLIVAWIAVAYVLSYAVLTIFRKHISGVAEKIVHIVYFPMDKLSGEGSQNDGSDLSVFDVKVHQAAEEEIVPRIESVGIIEYDEKVEINAKTSGRIEKFFVKQGQTVRVGQPLVQLERTFLQLDLDQQRSAVEAAQAELALAEEKYRKALQSSEGRLHEIEKQGTVVKKLRADLEKMRTTYQGKDILYQEGGISKEEYETIQTDLIGREASYRVAQKDQEISSLGFRDIDILNRGQKVPEQQEEKRKLLIRQNAAMEQAEVQVSASKVNSARAAKHSTEVLLKEATIISPINGIVATRNKGVGEQVLGGSAGNAAQAIMVIVDIGNVKAVINVKEADVVDLKQGMTMEFTVDVYKKDKFKGTIEVINPVVDSKTHTFEVKARLPNTGLKLRPGMFVRASVLSGEPRKTILVPASAILPADEKTAYVFVIRKGIVYRVKVETGKEMPGEKIEIRSGLIPGDLVAVDKLPRLRDGMRVNPMMEQR